jgi:hypothetical protein
MQLERAGQPVALGPPSGLQAARTGVLSSDGSDADMQAMGSQGSHRLSSGQRGISGGDGVHVMAQFLWGSCLHHPIPQL